MYKEQNSSKSVLLSEVWMPKDKKALPDSPP